MRSAEPEGAWAKAEEETVDLLPVEGDIEADQCNGSGYTFVSRIGAVRKFKTLEALEQFIDEEMRVYSTMREVR